MSRERNRPLAVSATRCATRVGCIDLREFHPARTRIGEGTISEFGSVVTPSGFIDRDDKATRESRHHDWRSEQVPCGH